MEMNTKENAFNMFYPFCQLEGQRLRSMEY